MDNPSPIDGYMAYDAQGKGDIDFLRRSPASCHSAVSNTKGIPWLALVRLGWSVRPVRIRPAGEPEEELIARPPVPDLPPPVPTRRRAPVVAHPDSVAAILRLLPCGHPPTDA